MKYITILCLLLLSCSKQSIEPVEEASTNTNTTIESIVSLPDTMALEMYRQEGKKCNISTEFNSEDTITLYYMSPSKYLKIRSIGKLNITDSLLETNKIHVVVKNKHNKSASFSINNLNKSNITTCSGQDTLIVGFYQVKSSDFNHF